MKKTNKERKEEQVKIDGKYRYLKELSEKQLKKAIELRCSFYTQQSEKLRLYQADNFNRYPIEQSMLTTQKNIEALYSELNKRLPKIGLSHV